MKEFGIDDDYGDDDDEDDEDYEYNGGDMSLYDSAIDDVDEIKFIKDTMTQIQAQNPNLFQRLMSGIKDPQQSQKFQELMNSIEQLIQQEKTVREQCEALDKQKK